MRNIHIEIIMLSFDFNSSSYMILLDSATGDIPYAILEDGVEVHKLCKDTISKYTRLSSNWIQYKPINNYCINDDLRLLYLCVIPNHYEVLNSSWVNYMSMKSHRLYKEVLDAIHQVDI